jgi:hypothetical protein
MHFISSKVSGLLATGLFLSVAVSGCASQQSEAPPASQKTVDVSKLQKSGTISFEGRAYNLFDGGTWGEGQLSYKGSVYKFKAKTIGAGYQVGVKDITVTGTVYDLKNVSDFSGTYWGVKAAGTVDVGAGVASVQNKNNVVIGIKSASEGFAADLGAGMARIVIQLM